MFGEDHLKRGVPLRDQSVISRVVRVAAGVFAPGHLGELTQVVPFELVDAVLAETGRVQHRIRELPSRVGVYFLLAMCLFPEVGYLLVWDKMTGALARLPAVVSPTAKALRDLRRRVGGAPMKALFEVLCGPLARPTTPGVRFGRYRTVSFDGCSSLKVPDTSRNRAWLDRLAHGGYPQLELMTLVETGTRAMIGAVFGPTATGETAYAKRLLHLLRPDMLVLWDKGFDGNDFITAVTNTGAQIVGRLRSNRRAPILSLLTDGSYLSVIGSVPVRIVDAQITVTCADGTIFDASYRLVTTLTDARRHPAGALVCLYHQRWEHESAYYALRHTILRGRVLRSGDPVGARAGDVGAAHALPTAAHRHGRRRAVPSRNRSRSLRVHHRLPRCPRPGDPSRRRPARSSRPHRNDRTPGAGQAAPTTTPTNQHPQGQVTDLPLRRTAGRWPARHQPSHHLTQHRRPAACAQPAPPGHLPR
jgi:hypothetical protein